MMFVFLMVVFSQAFGQVETRPGRELILERAVRAHVSFLSDQISFAREGIPGILLYTGFKHEGRQEGWSKKKFDEYYADKIHKPTDEYSKDWDMAGIMQIIRFAYEMTERVAEGEAWPKWNEGQPFKRIVKSY